MPVATFKDVLHWLDEFNRNYPRPRMEPISLSPLFDMKGEPSAVWPSADKPGVYCLFNESQELLKVGKASCNRQLGHRLRDYVDTRGNPKDEYFKDVRYVATIGVPIERAFEAPAIEEFLIARLDPPLNSIGRNST